MTDDDPSSPKPLHHGLYEAILPVTDLGRSIDFYVEKLGFEVTAEDRLPPGTVRISRADDGSGAFLLFSDGDVRWGLGLFQVDTVVHRSAGEYHISFRVAEADVEGMLPYLRERGIEPVYPPAAPLQGPVEEPIVHGWMPAAAVFFEDPDGHLLELIADLSDPPRPDFQWRPLSEWRALQG